MTPIVSRVSIFNSLSGELLYLAPLDYLLPVGAEAKLLPDNMSDACMWDIDTREFTENASLLETLLISELDSKREVAQMIALTSGQAKIFVYNQKSAEAVAAKGLAASTINGLSVSEKLKRFPFAYAEAKITGDSLGVVLARIDTGMTAAANEIARIEAIAQGAKRSIKIAKTAAEKRSAFESINWDWEG